MGVFRTGLAAKRVRFVGCFFALLQLPERVSRPAAIRSRALNGCLGELGLRDAGAERIDSVSRAAGLAESPAASCLLAAPGFKPRADRVAQDGTGGGFGGPVLVLLRAAPAPLVAVADQPPPQAARSMTAWLRSVLSTAGPLAETTPETLRGLPSSRRLPAGWQHQVSSRARVGSLRTGLAAESVAPSWFFFALLQLPWMLIPTSRHHRPRAQ